MKVVLEVKCTYKRMRTATSVFYLGRGGLSRSKDEVEVGVTFFVHKCLRNTIQSIDYNTRADRSIILHIYAVPIGTFSK